MVTVRHQDATPHKVPVEELEPHYEVPMPYPRGKAELKPGVLVDVLHGDRTATAHLVEHRGNTAVIEQRFHPNTRRLPQKVEIVASRLIGVHEPQARDVRRFERGETSHSVARRAGQLGQKRRLPSFAENPEMREAFVKWFEGNRGRLEAVARRTAAQHGLLQHLDDFVSDAFLHSLNRFRAEYTKPTEKRHEKWEELIPHHVGQQLHRTALELRGTTGIGIGGHEIRQIHVATLARNRLTGKLGREPTHEEIAAETGQRPHHVARWLQLHDEHFSAVKPVMHTKEGELKEVEFAAPAHETPPAIVARRERERNVAHVLRQAAHKFEHPIDRAILQVAAEGHIDLPGFGEHGRQTESRISSTGAMRLGELGHKLTPGEIHQRWQGILTRLRGMTAPDPDVGVRLRKAIADVVWTLLGRLRELEGRGVSAGQYAR